MYIDLLEGQSTAAILATTRVRHVTSHIGHYGCVTAPMRPGGMQGLYETVADAMTSGNIYSCQPEDTVDEGEQVVDNPREQQGRASAATDSNCSSRAREGVWGLSAGMPCGQPPVAATRSGTDSALVNAGLSGSQ